MVIINTIITNYFNLISYLQCCDLAVFSDQPILKISSSFIEEVDIEQDIEEVIGNFGMDLVPLLGKLRVIVVGRLGLKIKLQGINYAEDMELA